MNFVVLSPLCIVILKRTHLTCLFVSNWMLLLRIFIKFLADKVVMISVALLIIMFSVQKYATSKVGLVVGPALLIWFFSLGGIGTYNLIKYGSTVFKAFNPIHIYYYFERNSSQAWLSLGGCILCATGKNVK